MAYSELSFYSKTPIVNGVLDIARHFAIDKSESDVEWTITTHYTNRPGLLAYDLYGSHELWWVFAIRNPDILVDPLNDFVTGVTIMLPSKVTVMTMLGYSS
jgi:hypothetical protein